MNLHIKTWWIPLVVGSQTLGLKFSPSRMTDLILQDAGFTSTVSMTSSPPLSVTSPLATASASTPTPALLEPWPGQGELWLEMMWRRDLFQGSWYYYEPKLRNYYNGKAPQLLCLIPSKWIIWWSLVWEAKLWLSWKSSGFIVSGSWISLSGIWVKYLFANFLEA